MAQRYRQRIYQGRKMGAHRARFHEVFGWWPPVVRHTCDDGLCTDPFHLLPGTQADNMRDMVERGRGRYGRGQLGPTRNRAEYQRKRTHAIKAGTWKYQDQ